MAMVNQADRELTGLGQANQLLYHSVIVSEDQVKGRVRAQTLVSSVSAFASLLGHV